MSSRLLRAVLCSGLVCCLLSDLALSDAHARRRKRPRATAGDVSPPSEEPQAEAASSSAAEGERSAAPAAAGGGSSSSSSSSASGSFFRASSNGDKAGRFMANFKIGPALGAYNAGHMGAIVLDVGWSVLPNNNAYLLFPLQFQFASGGGAVFLPVGFQYDIAMPVRGLYIYPRASLGYAAIIASGGEGTITSHFGTLIPEFGVKYVLNGRWNFGGEPFSLPILFNSGGAALYYRILLSAGANF